MSGRQPVKPSSTSLHDIVKNIDAENYLIPEFQRGYDWKSDGAFKTRLFDSLFTRVFIGNIVLGKPSFDISCRAFDNRDVGSDEDLEVKHWKRTYFEENPQHNHYLVLDGQQRLTTIWRALKGYDKLYFVTKDLKKIDDEESEEIQDWMDEISESPTEGRICISLDDVLNVRGLKTPKKRESALKEILSTQSIYMSLDDEDEEKERMYEIIWHIQEIIYAFFSNKEICLQTKIDSSLTVFVKYFERANTSSKPLAFVDIIVAKIFENFKLRPKLNSFKKESNKLGYIKRIRSDSNKVFENLVRMVAFMSEIEMGSTKMLTELEATHFSKHFDLAVECFKKANEILAKYHLIHTSSDLPYPNMIVPVMAFVSALPNRDINKIGINQKSNLIDWYFRSGFTERYSKKAGEVLAKDTKRLKLLGGNKDLDLYSSVDYTDSFAPSRIQSEYDLIEFNSKSGSIRQAFLCWGIMKSGGVLDLRDSSHITSTQKTETHHIFPQKFLENGEDAWAKAHIHSIVNLIDISDSLNNNIKSKSPKAYLESLSNTELKKTLRKCLIPTDLLNYEEPSDLQTFLQKRAEIIFPQIEKFLQLSFDEEE